MLFRRCHKALSSPPPPSTSNASSSACIARPRPAEALSFRRADAAQECNHIGFVVGHGHFEWGAAPSAGRRVSGEQNHESVARGIASHLFLAVTSAFAETSARHASMRPLETAECRGVQLLKEQEIRSKYHRHNTTQNQQCMFISNAVVRAILVVSRVDGGVARQQQLHHGNVTIEGGRV